MYSIEISHVYKTFGSVRAVDDLSFSINEGEFFGLLGPNGAGKTTTIRLVLDILKPDHGKIAVLGGPIDKHKRDRIGYMPEERGLYQDITLEDAILYLASLKGLSRSEARRRSEPFLEFFELGTNRHKKIKELSKGMQQKAQIIATLLHQPDILIIDEPFSGLDPVNAQSVKDLLHELHRQGKTIVMSSHQMNRVEELCDRIMVINRGRTVLSGDIGSIRRQYAGQAVMVRLGGEMPSLKTVGETVRHNGSWQLNLAPGVQPQEVLLELIDQHAIVEHFEVALPSLDEIYIQVVQGKSTNYGKFLAGDDIRVHPARAARALPV